MNEENLYGKTYFNSREDPRREIAYAQDADKIRAREPGPILLDFGGGQGEFGNHLGDFNYYCFDPYGRRDENIPDALDVFVLRGVLQHLPDVVKTIKLGYDYLKPGGLIAILATPDLDSIGYRRFSTLPALDPPRNWTPMGRYVLTNILERIGYTGIELHHPYGKPYAQPVKNFFNFLIGKPDAFPGNMMDCFARKGVTQWTL